MWGKLFRRTVELVRCTSSCEDRFLILGINQDSELCQLLSNISRFRRGCVLSVQVDLVTTQQPSLATPLTQSRVRRLVLVDQYINIVFSSMHFYHLICHAPPRCNSACDTLPLSGLDKACRYIQDSIVQVQHITDTRCGSGNSLM